MTALEKPSDTFDRSILPASWAAEYYHPDMRDVHRPLRRSGGRHERPAGSNDARSPNVERPRLSGPT